MAQIPAAKLSPRIEGNGSIKWYYNDTFKLELEIKLTDEQGERINLEEGDTVSVYFYTKGKDMVKEFIFTEFEDNIITLNFDEDTTKKFKKGDYYYDIKHERNYRRTLAHENIAIVE